jgi:nucleotide-binding universal stress UspA family protein
MAMTRKIVCAIDGSAGANRALTVAEALARDLDAPLTLLHVLPEDPGGYPSEPVSLRRIPFLNDARSLFDAAHERLEPGHVVQTRVEFGYPDDELVEVGAEEDTEMLVVGCRGLGGFASAVLGSVSRTVADRARCPVMVVPPSGEPRPSMPQAKSVVCGVEAPGEDRHVIGVASDLAGRLELRLHLVTADVAPMPIVAAPGPVPPVTTLDPLVVRRERLLERLDSTGAGGELHVAYGPADRAIERVATEARARMIVVGSRGHGVLRRLLGGTVSGRLAAKAEHPVLVVSQPAEPSGDNLYAPPAA